MQEWTPAESKLCVFLAANSPIYRRKNRVIALTVTKYGVATIASLIACVLTEISLDYIGAIIMAPLYFAILVACRCFGKGPAWLCALISVPMMAWIISPDESLAMEIEEIPRLIGNIAVEVAILVLWPSAGFGDWSYRLSAIQRRTIASIKNQNSSSVSSIGRPSAASRSTITS